MSKENPSSNRHYDDNNCDDDDLRNFAETNNYSLLSDASVNYSHLTTRPIGSVTNGGGSSANEDGLRNMRGSSSNEGSSGTAAGGSITAAGGSTTATDGSITAAGGSTTAIGGSAIAADGFTIDAGGSTTAAGGSTTAAGGSTTAAGGSTTAADGSTIAAVGSEIAAGGFTIAAGGSRIADGVMNEGSSMNGYGGGCSSRVVEDCKQPEASGLSSEEIQRLIYKVKAHHDEAYLYLDQALQCDETRQTEQAMTLYNKAVRCIQLSLGSHDQLTEAYFSSEACKTAVKRELLNRSASINVDMEDLVNKMQRTIGQIHERVEELLLLQGAVIKIPSTDQAPPSYEESTNSNTLSPTSPTNSLTGPANATRLFYIEDGVQIYYITSDGAVSAPSYPSSLALYKFNSTLDSQPADIPAGFLQVGEWVYPLLPGTSPALHANNGAYLFPNVNSPLEGCTVGVMIPDSVDVSERSQFDKLLRSLTDLRQQTQRTSQQIARGISVAADWISWGLLKGAEKTRGLMESGSSALRERIEPNKDKSQIDATAQRTAQYAHRASSTAVRVSGYLVSKLGEATSALGRTVAPHIRRHSEQWLPASITQKDCETGHSTLDNFTEVAASGLQGFSTVYLALEQSAVDLAKSLANSTVDVIQHKFGEEAGQFTGDVVYSAGNVAVATHTMSSLGVKAVAKRVAKDTGRAVVCDETFNRNQPSNRSNNDHSNQPSNRSNNDHSHQPSNRSNNDHSNQPSNNTINNFRSSNGFNNMTEYEPEQQSDGRKI